MYTITVGNEHISQTTATGKPNGKAYIFYGAQGPAGLTFLWIVKIFADVATLVDELEKKLDDM